MHHVLNFVVAAMLVWPAAAAAQSPSDRSDAKADAKAAKQADRFVCVTAARANLRAAPATDARVNWVVYKYMPLVLVEKKDPWLRVRDVDGDLHWVHGSLVSDNVECVTVVSDLANVRRGAGTNFKKWFAVKRYTSFRKTGAEKMWIRVEYEGEVMWLYHTLIWPDQP